MDAVDKLDINMISYEWLDKTTNPKLLKKALQLLKEDGNYFPELSKAIDDKLQSVDEKYKKKKQNENISIEDIKASKEELLKFEQELKQNDKIIKDKQTSSELLTLQRQKEAENKKIKGNELMKTKEYDEAIKYYTNSINIYEYEPTTYCNRALAYIRNMQFSKALEDCNKAIGLKKDYIKAYYRRSICYTNLNDFSMGLEDLLLVLNDNPESKDINAELDKLYQKWKKYVGDDKWNTIKGDVDAKIQLALKGQYKKGVEIKKEEDTKEFVKVNIIEEKIEEPKKEEKKPKEGFKKIKIEEDDE